MPFAPTVALAALRGRARAFGRDRKGLSAVEFALILPLMLALYIGAVEFSHALTIDRRVTTAASAAADLVAQAKDIDDAGLADVFQAAGSMLTPYSAAPLSIVITSVTADENNVTTVDWSRAHNATPHGTGAPFPVPVGLTQEGTSVIVAEVGYVYTPTVGVHLTGGIALSERFYLRPRHGGLVQLN